MTLGELGCESDRVARVGECLFILRSDRSAVRVRSVARVGMKGPRDRPVCESERIVGIEMDRFAVARNCLREVFWVIRFFQCLRGLEICIERLRIAGPTQLDILGDVPEQCDLECIGYCIRDLSLQLQNITEI